MFQGGVLGSVILVAAAIAAALARPVPPPTPLPLAETHAVATAVRQGFFDYGFALGDGTFSLKGSGAPDGLTISVVISQEGRSWSVVRATAKADGNFEATAPIPAGIELGKPATAHVCMLLAARNINNCMDSTIEVPPVNPR